MTEQHHIGNATIIVTDDDFVNGYQIGYLRYHVDYKGRDLTDRDIYSYIMRTCLDVQHSDRSNAGRIAGWVAAMHEQERTR